MGKIDIPGEEMEEELLEEENSPEEEEEDTPPLELSIDEIIAEEGDIPTIRLQKDVIQKHKHLEKRCLVCFECDDIFDSESIHLLLQNDYKYYKKYKRYNTTHHFKYNQEPFSYMYEKKCWELKIFDKLFLFLRQRVKHYSHEPFSPTGLCSFFEYETLYFPEKCEVYLYRSYELMRRNFERFMKAATSYNVDHIDTPDFSQIIEDFSSLSIPSKMNIKNKEVGIERTNSRDEIPKTNIDRSVLPPDLLKSEDLLSRIG